MKKKSILILLSAVLILAASIIAAALSVTALEEEPLVTSTGYGDHILIPDSSEGGLVLDENAGTILALYHVL